jgi:hypothetical protein
MEGLRLWDGWFALAVLGRAFYSASKGIFVPGIGGCELRDAITLAVDFVTFQLGRAFKGSCRNQHYTPAITAKGGNGFVGHKVTMYQVFGYQEDYRFVARTSRK